MVDAGHDAFISLAIVPAPRASGMQSVRTSDDAHDHDWMILHADDHLRVGRRVARWHARTPFPIGLLRTPV